MCDCELKPVNLSYCRCLGILLQKIHDRTYVRSKIDFMYMQANISLPVNRLGLAKAMGLVIFLHLQCYLFTLSSTQKYWNASEFCEPIL